MKKLLLSFLMATISMVNFAIAIECNAPEMHEHDTNNVGHQFYDALVETPKDALVHTANAGRELAIATAELVVEAPLKTIMALKNGALKAIIKTKNGIIKGYQTMIKKPFVLAKKPTSEMGHRIKSASQTLAHGDNMHHDHEEHEHGEATVATFDDLYVLIIEDTKTEQSNLYQTPPDQTNSCQASFRVIIASPELAQRTLEKQECNLIPVNSSHEADINQQVQLSEKTLLLLSQAYQCINTDLLPI